MLDVIMLFAAGRGTRMKHLSQNQPKSMIPILDRPILFYVLDAVSKYPFKEIYINTHYLHEKIWEAVAEYQQKNPKCPPITIVHEEELLDTGGAIKNIFSNKYEFLGDNSDRAIFTCNTDTIIKANKCIFTELSSVWNAKKMDFMLMLQPYNDTVGYRGCGDFELEEDHKITRPDKNEFYSYMYAGIQIMKPSVVVTNDMDVFSIGDYFINSKKAYGHVINNIKWYHANTPDDIVDIEIDLLACDKRSIRQLD